MDSSETELNTKKFVPGSDVDAHEIFTYPFTIDSKTIEFIRNHGRIMFIIRGLPGTGKNSLCEMLVDRYPTAKVCSADDYFTDTFSSIKRESNSLKLSHSFCHKRVETACLKKAHPIIVKNTHVKKFELEKYLGFAAEFNYTVIMALTVNKFKMTPEILEKSNTKGLSAEYFKNRMRQWQDVVPINTGWFMGRADSTCLLNELKICLDYLLGDGKFCHVMNAYDKDELCNKLEVREEIYAIAACGGNNEWSEIKSYYMSKRVNKWYGHHFPLTVRGFVVTRSQISALVDMDKTMKDLYNIVEPRDVSRMDCLSDTFRSLSILPRGHEHYRTTKFDNASDVAGSSSTKLSDRKANADSIDIGKVCFMVVAKSVFGRREIPTRVVKELTSLLRSVANEKGEIEAQVFRELEDRFMFCRLSDEAWLIKPPWAYSYGSVFTGIYV